MKKIVLIASCVMSLNAFAQAPAAPASTQDKLGSAVAKAGDAKNQAGDAKSQLKTDPKGALDKAKASKDSASGAAADIKSTLPAKK